MTETLQNAPTLSVRDKTSGRIIQLYVTDDFAVRYEVNAACVRHGKTLVSGAIGRWTGQVGVFHGRPCYRCLVPEIPPENVLAVFENVMSVAAAVALIRIATLRVPSVI